ncbi:hypothetical protein GINT2_001500 [Glugoides intestinalis]
MASQITMKAYERGNKIVIMKNDEYVSIEKTINLLAKDFERLKSICEDRNTEDFPIDLIRKIITKCNELAQAGKNTNIQEDYINFMINEKDALKYVEKILKKAEEEQKAFEKKSACLKEFANLFE